MRIKYLAVLLLLVAAMSGFSVAANPQVTLQISGAVNGSIVLELYRDEAPVTVANFIDYVQSGFYDGLIFHRVMPGFMVQGGGFDANLVKKTPGPPIINESSNRLSNVRGTIAMARTTYADTATSEFFINVVDNTFLDFNSLIRNYYTGQYHAQIGYCVFGEVVSGMNVVDAIAAVADDDEDDVPDNDVIIQSATITLSSNWLRTGWRVIRLLPSAIK
jgi:cyclophilin family peptidyl-prolyl cis-trans isomerase